MDYLSVLLFIRDEQPEYVTEFVDYYLGQGVDTVYFIEHQPNSIPLPDLHHTQVIYQAPIAKVQPYYYWLALQEIKSEWCAVIDTDEFYVSKKLLVELLDNYKDYDALALNWLVFGCDHETRVFPVHGNYHMRTRYAYCSNRNIKCIVKPKAVQQKPTSPHYFNVKTVNTSHHLIETGVSNYVGDVARFNHYWTRSEEDWAARMRRGEACNRAKRTWTDFAMLNAMCLYDPYPTTIIHADVGAFSSVGRASARHAEGSQVQLL